jgi:hypothetical protein
MNLGKILFLVARYTTFFDSIVYALGERAQPLCWHHELTYTLGNGQLFDVSLSKQVNEGLAFNSSVVLTSYRTFVGVSGCQHNNCRYSNSVSLVIDPNADVMQFLPCLGYRPLAVLAVIYSIQHRSHIGAPGLLAVSIYAILGSMKKQKMILLVLSVVRSLLLSSSTHSLMPSLQALYIVIFTLMGVYVAEIYSL